MSAEEVESFVCESSSNVYLNCLRNVHSDQDLPIQARVHSIGSRLRSEFETLQELLNFHQQAVVASHCDQEHARYCYTWLVAGFNHSDTTGLMGSEAIERFRSLCDVTPIPMFLQDPEGYCVHVNKPLLNLLGVNPEHCLGRRWVEILAPEDRDLIMEQFTAALSARQVFRADFRVATSVDQQRWIAVQSAPLLNGHGTEIVRIGVVEDIEQRKQADLALRQSEEKFRILTETVPAAIFIYRGASLLYVNPTMQEFTGYSREELLRMPVWDVIHPDMREQSRTWAIGRQRDEGSVPSRYEVKLLTKDGATRWCDYTARIMEYDGAPAVLGVAVNIDDRIQAEAEAKRLHADLVHLSRVSTLGKLSTELAHELNQPLAAIMNYANGCRRRAHSAQEQDHPLLPAIDEIRSEAARAAQIVKRIRNFARKRPMQQTQTSINELITEATRLAQTGAGSDDLPVRFKLSENLPKVRVDRVQIIQVLVNLVTNALDAMRELDSGDRQLNISSTLGKSEEIIISVSDAGRGISGDLIDQLFEPFYTTKSEGLGLGLSISRSIIEAHGGRLWAESDPQSNGATFNIALPSSQGSNYGP